MTATTHPVTVDERCQQVITACLDRISTVTAHYDGFDGPHVLRIVVTPHASSPKFTWSAHENRVAT